MTTFDTIQRIIADNPDIEALSIVEFGKQKDLKNDTTEWQPNEDLIYQRARNLKESIGLPFWAGIMISSDNNPGWSARCIDASAAHNKSKVHIIAAKDFSKLDIENCRLGIGSKVYLKGGEAKHIPMLDFHLHVSDINEHICKHIAEKLSPQGGYILCSGNSYHFIGKDLISEDALLVFLAKAILYTPLTDYAWIAHQLIERFCTLRLSKKNGMYPRFICETEAKLKYGICDPTH